MINYPFRKRFEAIFFILAFIVSSFASYTGVSYNPSDIQSTLNTGDTVKITTKDNREVELKVVEVNSEAIVGENEATPYSNIQALEQKTVSTGGKILGYGLLTAFFLHFLGSQDDYECCSSRYVKCR